MNTFISRVAAGFLGQSLGRSQTSTCPCILCYRNNRFHHHKLQIQMYGVLKMIHCTAYTAVPLWKNLDFPRSPNPPTIDANPMLGKRLHWPVQFCLTNDSHSQASKKNQSNKYHHNFKHSHLLATLLWFPDYVREAKNIPITLRK